MVGLAKPGELQGRRSLFAAVRAFQGAAGRLAPGDHAIFTSYYRDDMGTVLVAALRNTTIDEERARNEGFLERLAAAVGEETLEAGAPTTLAEGQKALAWLAKWVGQPDEHHVN